VVERLYSTKGPHDLAHFFMIHSLGAIIQLIPEQLMDLLFSLESFKTVILTCKYFDPSNFVMMRRNPSRSSKTIQEDLYRCYLFAENGNNI